MRYRVWLTMIYAVLMTAVAHTAAAKLPCQHPDAATVAGYTVYSASQIENTLWKDTNYSGRRLQWLGTVEGLSEGSIYLLNCAGITIARLDIGAVKSLSDYPSAQFGGPAVMTIAQTANGTGYLEEDAQLVVLIGGKLKIVWSHPAYVFAAGWPWSTMKLFRQYFRFSRNQSGTRIYVSGTYLREYPAPAVKEKANMDVWFVPTDGHIAVVLPPEVYCWDGMKGKFYKCERLFTAAPPIATH